MVDFSLRQKLGQLFIVGFHGKHPDDPWIQEIAPFIAEEEVGGVILFSYNVESPVSLPALTHFLRNLPSFHPLFISIDQEGGLVQRLRSSTGFHDFPSPAQIAHGSLEEGYETYRALARELVEGGINLNFAPCVDVNPLEAPLCPVIGAMGRSFGTSPAEVLAYSRMILKAFHAEKLLGAIKHFPGHGSAQSDSHAGFVDVTACWQERELSPFYDLVQEKAVDMIMTAHIFNAALDPEFPATLSRATLDRLRQIGYDGVIISDDLHMGAIQAHYNLADAAIRSLNAGCDMIILSNNKAAAVGMDTFTPSPQNLPLLLDSLEEAVAEGLLLEERVEEAYRRVVALKRTLS